jgi:hypothetical protein
MVFARAMAVACLTVMKALLWFIGGLLLVLTVVQHFRGDADARPLVTVLTGMGFVAAGFVAGFAASWFQRAGQRQ